VQYYPKWKGADGVPQGVLSDGVRQLMELSCQAHAGAHHCGQRAAHVAQQRHNTLVAAHLRWWGGVHRHAHLEWDTRRSGTGRHMGAAAFHTSLTTEPCCLHGSFHQAVAQDRVCQEVGDCGSIPGRRSQAQWEEALSLPEEFSMDTLIAHIKRTAAEVESGDPHQQSVRRVWPCWRATPRTLCRSGSVSSPG
jgi:hypothetical protein